MALTYSERFTGSKVEVRNMYTAYRCQCTCEHCWPIPNDLPDGVWPGCKMLIAEDKLYPGYPIQNLCPFCNKNCENHHRYLNVRKLGVPAHTDEFLADMKWVKKNG